MIRALLFVFLLAVIALAFAVAMPYMVLLFVASIGGAIYGSRYWLNLFIVFDQFANAALAPILNRLFKKPRYKFGWPDETISSVFGKNIMYYPNDTDKSIYIVDKWLSKIDPTSKQHSVDSIEHDEQNN